MLITTFVAVLGSLLVSVQADRHVDVFAWPLSSTESQSLARISYDSSNATVAKYTPLTTRIDDEVVRVGFYHGSGSWSGVATAASNFAPGKDKKVQLYINNENELYHIGFKASDQPSSSKTGTPKDDLGVEVVRLQKGQMPYLNKPVVLSADGKAEPAEEEKTFLQK